MKSPPRALRRTKPEPGDATADEGEDQGAPGEAEAPLSPAAPVIAPPVHVANGLREVMVARQRDAGAEMVRAIEQARQAFVAQYQFGDALRAQIVSQHERTMRDAAAQLQALQAAAATLQGGPRGGQ